MFKTSRKLFICLILLFAAAPCMVQAQNDYRTAQQLSGQLEALARQYSSVAKLQSIGKSEGGNDIWVLTIGSGEVDNHPAVAVVGGADGRYLTGPELSYRFAESLLSNASSDSVRQILSTTTFYILPNVNPDAVGQYAAPIKYARTGNARATDDDRDGRNGEDPYEDLNNDGFITMMRVADPTGSWKKSEADERIMVKAPAGEAGGYLYLTEGADNDKDGQWNEDGPGGINFNKSLTWDFPYFEPGAGDFPVADKENRAVLDFLFDRWNVFSVVTFGSSDNLNAAQKYNASEASKRVLKAPLKNDVELNELVARTYAELVGKKEGAQPVLQGGGFMEWAYFHYARYSYGTPAWTMPAFQLPEDSAAKASYKPNKDKNKEVDYLRWAELRDHDIFVPWSTIAHPDFPGKAVEVGGWKPYASFNPPYSEVADIATAHNKFLMKLAAMKPQIKIENVRVEPVGKGVYRITADIFNPGTFATMTELAEKTRWVRKTKVEMKLGNNQQLAAGNRVELLSAIPGGGKKTLTWLVKGSGSATLSAGSAQTGIDTQTITLK